MDTYKGEAMEKINKIVKTRGKAEVGSVKNKYDSRTGVAKLCLEREKGFS